MIQDSRENECGEVIIISTGWKHTEKRAGRKSKTGENRKTEAWSLQAPILGTRDVLFLDLCFITTIAAH